MHSRERPSIVRPVSNEKLCVDIFCCAHQGKTALYEAFQAYICPTTKSVSPWIIIAMRWFKCRLFSGYIRTQLATQSCLLWNGANRRLTRLICSIRLPTMCHVSYQRLPLCKPQITFFSIMYRVSMNAFAKASNRKCFGFQQHKFHFSPEGFHIKSWNRGASIWPSFSAHLVSFFLNCTWTYM